jgi:hypothetical protein
LQQVSNAPHQARSLLTLHLALVGGKRRVCSNNGCCMDTPFPILSPEAFDAMMSNAQSAATSSPSAASPPSMSASGVNANLSQALAWSLELAPQVISNLVSRSLQSMDRKLVTLLGTEQAHAIEAAAVAMEEQRLRWSQQITALLRMAIAYPSPAKMASILPKVDLRICATEAAQLDALVQQQGSRRGNPLAPQAYVQAILELLSRSEASPTQRQIWAEHLLGALSSQLAWVYLQLHAVLRDPSSREASALSQAAGFDDYAAIAYGFARAEPDAVSGDDEAATNTQTQVLAEQARRTVVRLRKYLGLTEASENALAQALSGDAMALLLDDLDQAEQLMAQIRERGLPMPSLDDETEDSAGQVGQAQASVAAPVPAAAVSEDQISEQIAELIKTYQNTTSPSLQRVPVPLREALEDLKLPLLHLALQDAKLLSDIAHPARQLLEMLAQRSLRYSSEMAEGFTTFMSPVSKLIEAVASVRQPSARVYEQAGSSLRALWQRQDEAVALAQARLEQEKEQLQAAKVLAGRLAFELVGRRDAGDAPPVIKQFLMGPWAQVLAKAQLFPDRPDDAQRYTQVLVALLWSVSVRRAAARKTEHAALLPKLMPALKEGLQSIKLADVQIDGHLSDIKKLHDAVQATMLAADTDTSVSDPAPLLAI